MGSLSLFSYCYAIFPRHLKRSYPSFLVCLTFGEKEALQKHLQFFGFFLSEELLMKCGEMLLNLQVPYS